jgi:UDP-N-acetylmuramate dehydrogenase
MSRHTSLQVGGAADFFICPADLPDLEALLLLLEEHAIPFLAVGGGCNLLVRDGGVRGAVISLERFDRLDPEGDDGIRAGAGVDTRALVTYARERCLTGLECLVGVPGRLGGVLAMNAGVGGQSVTDSLETLVTLKEGNVTATPKDRLESGYRFLGLAPGELILEAVFRLRLDLSASIEARMEEWLERRRETQGVGYPSAGSFFKNPLQAPAWRLIDEAGLRGYRIGGAQVSEIHTNFLVNRGGATAGDFLALAALIKNTVREKTGIELEEEVRIVGED